MKHYILVINPGSTSTKISIFNNQEEILKANITHGIEELSRYSKIIDQYLFRKQAILNYLKEEDFNLKLLTAVVGRGGVIKPVKGGTYLINETLIADLKLGVRGEHASNLGGILSYDIANSLSLPSYIVDPVVVDELAAVARFSGSKYMERLSIFHALNQKTVARVVAKELGKTYETCDFVVAHLGGGITVGVHNKGKVIDVNNGLDGDGPFSPERSGGLPFGGVIDFCLKHKDLTKQEIIKYFVGNGGLVSYLGTNSGKEVQERINKGDPKAKLVYNAMVYQIAKEIGSCLMVLNGKYDAIILTGGLTYWNELLQDITAKLAWTNLPLKIIKGEDEMKALALGVLRVLKAEEAPKIY